MEIITSAATHDDGTVARHSFAPGAELLTVDWPDGRHAATLVLEVDRDVTADELRALATHYEAFPAWLRARAAEQDSRS
ncbi:hypothetical protein [uncultured Microbacterium sp.]|uniref:hypothetical protein n=1 Tax=uncultured Microbacterium sp. TaxID=191216 RepID=UPI0025FD2B7F|nr:hypothetical protein [uncultured Microbacterium sp.]